MIAISTKEEVSATNQSLTIFAISNTVLKNTVVLLRVSNKHSLKDNKQILLNAEAESANNKNSQLYYYLGKNTILT